MKYNKAIRDKIPEIIEQSGKKCNVKILSDEAFLEKLEEKLTEEVLEYQESKSLEELADILEVINRILKIKGIKKEKLEEIQIMKKDERGGFDKNLFLIDTTDLSDDDGKDDGIKPVKYVVCSEIKIAEYLSLLEECKLQKIRHGLGTDPDIISNLVNKKMITERQIHILSIMKLDLEKFQHRRSDTNVNF
jgi:predicted house-cleaning noncanonical NTP pyrophosphatase (MazG superfamily)